MFFSQFFYQQDFAEHQLRKEFKAEAMKKCDLQIKAFAECGREEGLMVIFKCRDFQRSVNECMAVYNSNERWELYKKENAQDLDKRVIQSTD